MMKSLGLTISLCATMLLGAACGDDAPQTLFHVGGTISGLTTAGLVIENNNGDDDAIAINAPTFVFPTAVATGAGYHVTVLTQPTGLFCTVSNGTNTAITADVNDVVITCAVPTATYSVTPSGTNVSITPDSAQVVASGATQAFSVTPDDTYVLSNTVGGTCAAGTWNDNVYTTGAVTADCTVIFSATQASFTVTPSAAAELMVNPSEPQTVADGSTQAFTLFANVGYSVSQVVGGDCPAGSWSDNVYTTGPIIADCAVSFSAAIDTFTVTSSGDGNETISPSTPQTVEYDSTQSFVVTANTGFAVSLDVGGTCPTGSWSDNVYTTGTITSDCAVIFAAAASATTITASLSTLNLATSGTNRVIVFTNTGSAPTSGLQAQFPTFPVGTSSDFADCASGLGAGDSCAIVVSPGATASTEPLTITVSGDNTNTLNVQVNVVTYGSILQGGYVFAIDDTTASTSSIGGSIAGLTDITSGVQWGAPTLTLATSLTDGATDTAIIVAAYGVGNYAAALCANFSIDDGGNSPCAGGTCFDSWYLPSVCELASSGGSASCPSGIANMTDNLDSLIDGCEGPSCLLGGHWSSSELSFNASFLQNFEPVAASQSLNSLKQGNVAVRCARALTP